jgi:hypothetical protein
MHSTAYYPTYRFNLFVLTKVLASMAVGRNRDYSSDARELIKGINPPFITIGVKNIPISGPFLVTLNHYSRSANSGFNVFWAAAALSSVMPKSPIWLMTSAWTDRTKGLDQVRTGLTRVLFTRLARIYGFVTTPPMPTVPDEAVDRALSIRNLHRHLRNQPLPILCLAPEGMDFPGGILGFPPDGMGKFINHVYKDLKRILPVGVYEEDGKLILNFGRVYGMEAYRSQLNNDRQISLLVMKKIAALLPARLRGQYSESQD